jgi:type II secretory pathway pseudopilin PulG
MTPARAPSRLLGSSRPAFTLVEAVIATLLVSGLLVVSMNTLGSSAAAQRQMVTGRRAELLAQDLLAEVMRQEYEDPAGVVLFGREPDELGTNRSAFDDVDDYHMWAASPPQHRDGTVMADLAGWMRVVMVKRVLPDSLGAEAGSETGVKRITVIVAHDGVFVTEMSVLKTDQSGLDGSGG